MSRIYHNEPLQSVPVTSHQWPGTWKASTFKTGKGILLEGTIELRTRHVITTDSVKERYLVVHVKVTRAHRRQFDASGTEVEPNFSETTVERTGYLHSSYKTVAKGETDALSEAEVRSLVEKPDLTKLTEKASAALAFWILETEIESIELNNNDQVRLKTSGDGPFIESIAKIDKLSSTVGNYAGSSGASASWTEKVMNVKAQKDEQSNPAETGDGAADEDWDD